MRERRKDILERPLGPESLVGSWFNHYDDDDQVIEQGIVVAEVQPGAYLLELDTFQGREQRLMSLLQLLEHSDEWRFYDNDDWMRGNAGILGGN
jgi:hypothetical protein